MNWTLLQTHRASRVTGSALLTQVPAVLFWQHRLKINRSHGEMAWGSIAGHDQTLYKLTAVQVSVAGICGLQGSDEVEFPCNSRLGITQSLGGDIWDQ